MNGVTLVDENVEEGSVRARAIEILTVREAIDAGEVEIQLGNEKLEKKRKYNSKRPENWRVITQYYIDNGFIHLRNTFGKDVSEYTDKALKLNLRRAWIPDLNNMVTDEVLQQRLTAHKPGYGFLIDEKLKEKITIRMTTGLSVDDIVLRNLALGLLQEYGKEDLLRTKGGIMSLGQGWAQRFWKRHNFPSRGDVE